MMRKVTFAFALAGIALTAPALAQEGGLLAAHTKVSDVASLQRGAHLYFNYCLGCHSLKYESYSRLATDLKLSPDEVLKDFASFTGAKIGDQIVSSMPANYAQAWFGKVPPDLSLEGRAKGPDWIYSYLKSFYLDPSASLGWNNTVFVGAAMPNPLWELQGTQVAHYAPAKAGAEPTIEKLDLATKGRLSGEEFDAAARDIAAFLQYVGEPAALQREAVGMWVMVYLVFFTFLAWLLNKEYWKGIH